MGNNGYWSWVWSMIFVFVGTLLIVLNHVVRNFFRKKNGTFRVKSYDQKAGSIGSIIIVVVAASLLATGIILMKGNAFIEEVTYNGFNVGLILLVLGISVLLCLGISLPKLFSSFKKENNLTNE